MQPVSKYFRKIFLIRVVNTISPPTGKVIGEYERLVGDTDVRRHGNQIVSMYNAVMRHKPNAKGDTISVFRANMLTLLEPASIDRTYRDLQSWLKSHTARHNLPATEVLEMRQRYGLDGMYPL